MAKKAKKKRRYSKSSGSDVKSEMRRYKKGTAKSGRGGKGGKKQEAGDRDRTFQGPQKRQESPQEKEVMEPMYRSLRSDAYTSATFTGTRLKTSG
ncbi:hypothetical protein ACVIM9_005026 [Bradyrhizobium sp. USDA 4520]